MDIMTYALLMQKIQNITTGAISSDDVKTAVKQYLEDNPDEVTTQQELENALTNYLKPDENGKIWVSGDVLVGGTSLTDPQAVSLKDKATVSVITESEYENLTDDNKNSNIIYIISDADYCVYKNTKFAKEIPTSQDYNVKSYETNSKVLGYDGKSNPVMVDSAVQYKSYLLGERVYSIYGAPLFPQGTPGEIELTRQNFTSISGNAFAVGEVYTIRLDGYNNKTYENVEAFEYNGVVWVGNKKLLDDSAYDNGIPVVLSDPQGKWSMKIKYNFEQDTYLQIYVNKQAMRASISFNSDTDKHFINSLGEAWFAENIYIGGTSPDDCDYVITDLFDKANVAIVTQDEFANMQYRDDNTLYLITDIETGQAEIIAYQDLRFYADKVQWDNASETEYVIYATEQPITTTWWNINQASKFGNYYRLRAGDKIDATFCGETFRDLVCQEDPTFGIYVGNLSLVKSGAPNNGLDYCIYCLNPDRFVYPSISKRYGSTLYSKQYGDVRITTKKDQLYNPNDTIMMVQDSGLLNVMDDVVIGYPEDTKSISLRKLAEKGVDIYDISSTDYWDLPSEDRQRGDRLYYVYGQGLKYKEYNAFDGLYTTDWNFLVFDPIEINEMYNTDTHTCFVANPVKRMVNLQTCMDWDRKFRVNINGTWYEDLTLDYVLGYGYFLGDPAIWDDPSIGGFCITNLEKDTIRIKTSDDENMLPLRVTIYAEYQDSLVGCNDNLFITTDNQLWLSYDTGDVIFNSYPDDETGKPVSVKENIMKNIQEDEVIEVPYFTSQNYTGNIMTKSPIYTADGTRISDFVTLKAGMTVKVRFNNNDYELVVKDGGTDLGLYVGNPRTVISTAPWTPTAPDDFCLYHLKGKENFRAIYFSVLNSPRFSPKQVTITVPATITSSPANIFKQDKENGNMYVPNDYVIGSVDDNDSMSLRKLYRDGIPITDMSYDDYWNDSDTYQNTNSFYSVDGGTYYKSYIIGNTLWYNSHERETIYVSSESYPAPGTSDPYPLIHTTKIVHFNSFYEGRKFNVRFNGVDEDKDMRYNAQDNDVYLGNLHLVLDTAEDTGEPYYISGFRNQENPYIVLADPTKAIGKVTLGYLGYTISDHNDIYCFTDGCRLYLPSEEGGDIVIGDWPGNNTPRQGRISVRAMYEKIKELEQRLADLGG